MVNGTGRMKLPNFTATTPPPKEPYVQETGLVRATDIGALTQTGEQAKWGAVGQIGGGLKDVASFGLGIHQAKQESIRRQKAALEKRRKLDDAIQFGNATQRISEIYSNKIYELENTDFKMDMPEPNSPDYDKVLVANSTAKRQKWLKESLAEIDERVKDVSTSFSTVETQEKFKTWYNGSMAQFVDSVRRTTGDKLDSFQRAELNKLWQDAAKNGNVETANDYIETMDKYELITPEKAAGYKQSALKLSEEQGIREFINFAATTLVQEDIKVASDEINNSKVFTEKEKQPLRNLLTSVINRAKAQQKEFEDKQDSEANKELTDLFLNNKLTMDDITARRDLLKDEKYQAWARIVLNPSVSLDYDKYDEIKDMLDGVAAGTETTANVDKKISEYAGKYFDGGTAITLRNKLSETSKPDSPLKSDVAIKYKGLLKEAKTDRVFSLDKVQNSIIYGRKEAALIKYITDFREKNKRDVTDDEIRPFYEQMVDGYRKPESPFTEAKVQQMLGELESGGSVSIYGFVMKFTKPQQAVDHALRTLGPNWQEISPEAVEIIKRKWPEADVAAKTPSVPKEKLEVGERRVHPNGGVYEYTGLEGDKAWKLVKE